MQNKSIEEHRKNRYNVPWQQENKRREATFVFTCQGSEKIMSSEAAFLRSRKIFEQEVREENPAKREDFRAEAERKNPAKQEDFRARSERGKSCEAGRFSSRS